MQLLGQQQTIICYTFFKGWNIYSIWFSRKTKKFTLLYLDEEKEASQGWTHQKTGNGAKGKKSGSIWAWRGTTGCSHPHLNLFPSDIKRNQKLFKMLGERSNYSNIFKRLLYLRARCIVNRIDHIFVLHNVSFFCVFVFNTFLIPFPIICHKRCNTFSTLMILYPKSNLVAEEVSIVVCL